MKNGVFTLWVLFICCACKGNLNKLQSIENKVVINRSEYDSKFKYHDLNVFKIEHSILNSLIKLDSVEWKTIFQNSLDYTYGFNECYFYSNFSDATKIALLEKSEAWNSLIIWLVQFNKKGKFIGRQELAIRGADGGDWWESYGRFDNRKYIKTDLFENRENERDSSIVKLTFLKTGKVKIDTLFADNNVLKTGN